MKRFIPVVLALLLCLSTVSPAQQTVQVPSEAITIRDPLLQDFNLGCVDDDCTLRADGYAITRPLIDVDYNSGTSSGEVQNPGASMYFSAQTEHGAHKRCTAGDRFDLACAADADCPGASTCVEPGTSSTSDFQPLWFQQGLQLTPFTLAAAYRTDPIWKIAFNALDNQAIPTNADYASVTKNLELAWAPLVSRLPTGSDYFPSIIEDYTSIQRMGETESVTPGAGDATAWRPFFFGSSVQGKGDYASDTAHFVARGRIPMLGSTEYQQFFGVRLGWSTPAIRPQFSLKLDGNLVSETLHYVEGSNWTFNEHIGSENANDLDPRDDLSSMNNLKEGILNFAVSNTGSLQGDRIILNLDGPNPYGACENNAQPMCVGGGEAGEPCEEDANCSGGTCSGTMPDASVCISDFHCRPDDLTGYEASSGNCTKGDGVDDTGTNDGICSTDAGGALTEVFCDDPGTQDNCAASTTCVDIQTYYTLSVSTAFARYTEMNFGDADLADSLYYPGYCSDDEGMLCFDDSQCAGAATCIRTAGSRYAANMIMHENKLFVGNTGVAGDVDSSRLPPAAAGTNINNVVMERYRYDFAGANDQHVNAMTMLQFRAPNAVGSWDSNGNTIGSNNYILEFQNQRASAGYEPILILINNQGANTLPVVKQNRFGYDEHWELGDGRIWNADEGQSSPGAVDQFRVKWNSGPTAFGQGNAIAESSIAGAAGISGSLVVLDGTDGHRFKAVAANVDLLTNSMLSATDIITTTDTSLVLTAVMLGGSMHISNNASGTDYTLPTAVAGMNACFYDINGGGVITVDANTDDLFLLDGTALSTGFAIDSPGAIGDTICIVAIDNVTWITLNRSGTWIDGGA